MIQKVFFKTRTERVFKISFWNAGGLTNYKFIELKTIVLNNDLDIMGAIVECGCCRILIKKYGPSFREPRRIYWNLKKANWAKFKNLTNEVLTDSLVIPNFEYSSILFTLSVLKCASLCVPRGQQKKYTPFWNENLQKLKKDRDEARELARNTGLSKDCIALRKAQAMFKKSNIEAKRSTYKNFLEKLDFRRDGVKAPKFLSQLNNKKILRNEPIKKGSKECTSDKDISSVVCWHYARVSNYKPNFKILKSDLKPQQNNNSADFQQLFNDDFNLEELINGISTLVKGKSAGPDGILPEFLINLGDSAIMT
ncbi:uncharacterized protein TNCT_89181, partial [Trichonephila clavata]